jgi:succinate-semialdehyde dehydrogenase/glutarate-semialdehyde dehydrogenase
MGNAVIIKPTSGVALTLIRYTEWLIEAGVPGNVVQVVTGAGATIGGYLVDTNKINCVSFTGSTEVGIALSQCSARYMHRILMELGGNDPFIVFDDANIEAAVEDSMLRLITAGQTCCTAKRFIVHNKVRERFTMLLIERLKKVKIGDPQLEDTELSCCVSEKAAKDVESQVNETISQGAELLFGGKCNGAFYEPTVLGSVTKDMDVAKDMEIFGPVFPIIGFDTEDEAVAVAIQTRYGLNAGVMSGDMIRGLRVASKIQAGTVVANGSGHWRNTGAPFGGYKMSGIGREGIRYTLEEMSQLKTIAIKGIN